MPIKGVQHVARGALAGLRSPHLRPGSGSVSFDEDEAIHALPPADYLDPSESLTEEPVDLFTNRHRKLTPKQHPTGPSKIAEQSPSAPACVPLSYTPSSLGVIPELSLDGGSSAEDTDKNDDDAGHAQGSSADEEAPVPVADEWEGWKLDGIDDEPLEETEALHQSPLSKPGSSNTLSRLAAPSAYESAEPSKVHQLLSAASSAAPSPVHRDLLGSSPSSLSSSGGGVKTASKKKKQRGKR